MQQRLTGEDLGGLRLQRWLDARRVLAPRVAPHGADDIARTPAPALAHRGLRTRRSASWRRSRSTRSRNASHPARSATRALEQTPGLLPEALTSSSRRATRVTRWSRADRALTTMQLAATSPQLHRSRSSDTDGRGGDRRPRPRTSADALHAAPRAVAEHFRRITIPARRRSPRHGRPATPHRPALAADLAPVRCERRHALRCAAAAATPARPAARPARLPRPGTPRSTGTPSVQQPQRCNRFVRRRKRGPAAVRTSSEHHLRLPSTPRMRSLQRAQCRAGSGPRRACPRAGACPSRREPARRWAQSLRPSLPSLCSLSSPRNHWQTNNLQRQCRPDLGTRRHRPRGRSRRRPNRRCPVPPSTRSPNAGYPRLYERSRHVATDRGGALPADQAMLETTEVGDAARESVWENPAADAATRPTLPSR